MFKQKQRIKKTRELQKVYRLGKTSATPALVIKFVPAKDATQKTRTAFVVSKKVSKKAVERNRIKRALREEMRIKERSLPVGDYMVILRYSAAQNTNAQLRAQLHAAIRRFR